MIRDRYPDEYHKINSWIFDQYKELITDGELLERFSCYCLENHSVPDDETALAERVLKAAHRFSSLRELQMIEKVNERERTEKIKTELLTETEKFSDLEGMRLLMDRKSRPFQFIMKIEQLRFQTRWNQTPRVPKTSVLGHCIFVAFISLLLLRDSCKGHCRQRLFNDFFCGLFHDLPESVTRDIISPVKQATTGLPGIVKQIEDEIVHEELVPLMETFYVDEILYFTSNEFQNRILIRELDGGKTSQKVSFEELQENYNSDVYSPVDGKLVRLADHLSAMLEADSSIKYGITSRQLASGRDNILKMYMTGTKINGIDAMKLFWSVMES